MKKSENCFYCADKFCVILDNYVYGNACTQCSYYLEKETSKGLNEIPL